MINLLKRRCLLRKKDDVFS